MNPEEETPHQKMVSELAKPGEEVIKTLDLANKILLLNALQKGVHAGNYVDTVKKQVIYNKPQSFPARIERLVWPRAEKEFTPAQGDLAHMSMGILGEAAEVMAVIQDHIEKEEPLDVDNLIEELGDIEFYLEGLRQAIGVSRQEILDTNIVKLRKRYESGYSDQAAQNRADKA
jgi:NTP pyrophosphatase (non-canonical NTP hydrolase)